MKFFISYSRSVKSSVDAVIDELAKTGHEIWWDGDIPVIGDWWETILKNIEACEVFIFMISEKAVQSDYCLAELRYAVDLNIPILPFIIDDCIIDNKTRYPIPSEINDSRVQWLNYNGNVKGMLARIDSGCSHINWAYYQRVPQNRPPEPNTGSETLTKQFQQAVTLADDGHFTEAIKRLRNVARLEPRRLGDLCHQWELKLTAYQQIVEYADHKATMSLARKGWATYIEQFKDDDDLFDPLSLAEKLAAKSVSSKTVSSRKAIRNRVLLPWTLNAEIQEIMLRLGMPINPQTDLASQRYKKWHIPTNIEQLLMSGTDTEFDRERLLHQARTIESTLLNFGSPGYVVEINISAMVIQFGIEPAALTSQNGKKNFVKISSITRLAREVQSALNVNSIRFDKPILGKNYVHIEIPNDKPSIISLRDIISTNTFKELSDKSSLTIALGQSLDGSPKATDLASLPHLLIAGAIDSGVSMCKKSIITNLIIQNSPDSLKLLIVAPNNTELKNYNGIPHLIAPVMVKTEKIIGGLNYISREMEERYRKLESTGAFQSKNFNKNLLLKEMPYLVVIIDELADFMMLLPDETEHLISHIAAFGSMVKIHLIVATHYASTSITDLIKAKFLARIAFAMENRSESQVILNQSGAENLLGRGDMLYIDNIESGLMPLRLQGTFLSSEDIQNVTNHWKNQIKI